MLCDACMQDLTVAARNEIIGEYGIQQLYIRMLEDGGKFESIAIIPTTKACRFNL